MPVDHRLAVGERAPLFRLPDHAARETEFRPEASAASVVVFTANGCPFAQAWHDRVQDVARDYAGRDVVLLQVVSNDDAGHPEDSTDEMARRVERGELAGPFLHDAEQAVAQAYGATATPEVFVVDQAGVLRYHGAPDGDHDDPGRRAEWLRAALDDVLAGREVARPLTPPAGCSIKWRVRLLWWQGCPTHARAAELLHEVLGGLGRGEVRVVEEEVRTPGDARRHGFPGSPTFQVGGRDLFPVAAPPALTCRVYARGDERRASPLPDTADLAERLRDVLARPWDLPHWADPRRPAKPATSPQRQGARP